MPFKAAIPFKQLKLSLRKSRLSALPVLRDLVLQEWHLQAQLQMPHCLSAAQTHEVNDCCWLEGPARVGCFVELRPSICSVNFQIKISTMLAKAGSLLTDHNP